MNEYTNNNEIRNEENDTKVLKIKSSAMVEIPLNTTQYDRQARADKLNEIIAYFEDNPEVFNSALEELDDYNGELGDERVYPMWELCDHFGNLTLREFLNKTRDNFDLSAGYFKYTCDGNVESCEEPDYSNHYYSMGYAVEELHDNRAHIMGTLEDNPELLDLFDDLDRIENGEDEEDEEDEELEDEEPDDEEEEEPTPIYATCVKIAPNKPAEICKLKSELKALQNAVSDHGEPSLIEYSFPFDDDVMVLGNEEAKLIHMTPNRIINGELYCGTIYIVKDDKAGNLTDLTEEEQAKYLEMFKDPAQDGKEKFSKQLSDLLGW